MIILKMMMMSYNEKVDPVISVIKGIFGEPKKHNRFTNQLSYECPVCADNKDNLEINTSLLVMKCWKCSDDPEGLKGSLRKLVKTYGSNIQLKLYDTVTDGYEVKKFKREYTEETVLPKEYVKIENLHSKSSDYTQATNYLFSRGFNLNQIIENKIGACFSGKYNNRIIVPSYDAEGKLNYFIGRTMIGEIPKFKNPIVPKEDFIINESEINWDGTIYLVEGMFDRIGLGIKNTIPLLGKVLHQKLLEKIISNAKGYIVVSLDPDAKWNAYNIYNKLSNIVGFENRVRIIELPNNMDWAEIRSKYGIKGIYKCLKMVKQLTEQERYYNVR